MRWNEAKMVRKVQIGRKLERARKLRKIASERSASVKTGRCLNLSCLNAATYVLKIDKGLVKNFLAQERRLQLKLQLMGKAYWVFPVTPTFQRMFHKCNLG